MFSIFLNQLITAVALFHCCSCNLFRNSLLIFTRITLLNLPILFFTGLMSLAVALFSKFGLWSFNIQTLLTLKTFSFAVDLDSVKNVFFISYFSTLVVDGFSGVEICFFVGLGYRIMEKLLVYLFGYFIKIGCCISQC